MGLYGTPRPELVDFASAATAAQAEIAAVPPIEERIAAAVHLDPASDYFAQILAKARQGEFATVYGTSGHFAGMDSRNSDRAQLDKHFSQVGLANAWRVADRISGYIGPSMPARDFYSFDDASSARVAELVASRTTFALTGTSREIAGYKQLASSDTSPERQLWIPTSDKHGALPVYTRITGPTANARTLDRALLSQDWLILPQLHIPTRTVIGRAALARS